MAKIKTKAARRTLLLFTVDENNLRRKLGMSC
jgi:hypothetical protein